MRTILIGCAVLISGTICAQKVPGNKSYSTRTPEAAITDSTAFLSVSDINAFFDWLKIKAEAKRQYMGSEDMYKEMGMMIEWWQKYIREKKAKLENSKNK